MISEPLSHVSARDPGRDALIAAALLDLHTCSGREVGWGLTSARCDPINGRVQATHFS